MESKQKINEIKLSKKGNAFLKTFTRFLKEHHCFARFQRAFYKQKGYTANYMLKYECEYCSKHIIDTLLTWMDTQEGHEYWRKLNNEFHDSPR